MKKIVLIFMILTSSILIPDPLAEMIWMRSSKDDFLYTYVGNFFGVEYVKTLEIPTAPADLFLVFTGCDKDFLKAIIREESNFKVHATSPTGALGVGQIVRSTAKWLKVRNPYNPVTSSFAICRYIKHLSSGFKTKEEILWAYHDGEGAVRKRGPSNVARSYAKTVLKFYDYYKTHPNWVWFKDRVLLKASIFYFPLTSFSIRLGSAFSILGTIDIDGGYLLSDTSNGFFSKVYLRVFHDLAIVGDFEPDGMYVGTSFWDLDHGIEVLVKPGYGKARMQFGNFGIMMSTGHLAAFYRMGF